MMPNCSFKRCNRVAKYLLTVEWRKHRYGEGICLCEKHLRKFPDLEFNITEDLKGVSR